jgi:hypothetical protein
MLDINRKELPVNKTLVGDLQEQMNQGNTKIINLVSSIVRLVQEDVYVGIHCESGEQLLEIVEDAITHKVI